MNRSFYPPARFLLAAIFVWSGYSKLVHFSATEGFMAHVGIPAAAAALIVAIIVELGGGLLVIAGLFTRWAAGVMFLYLIPVTWYMHRHDTVQIMKNISIMGGLLLLVAGGGGACALDASRSRAKVESQTAA